jgi:hypothetical protein
MNTYFNFFISIKSCINHRFQLFQRFSGGTALPFSDVFRYKCNTAQQLSLGVIGGMNSYQISSRNIHQMQVPFEFGAKPLLQDIFSLGNTRNLLLVSQPGQFDGITNYCAVPF